MTRYVVQSENDGNWKDVRAFPDPKDAFGALERLRNGVFGIDYRLVKRITTEEVIG